MSNVMDLRAARLEPPASPAFLRLRRASRLFDWLFTALFWGLGGLTAAFAAAFLIYAGDHLLVTSHSFEISFSGEVAPGETVFGALPLQTRIAYALAAAVRSAPVLLIFHSLGGLFRLYADGVVFAPDNSAKLKRVGLGLVAAAFAPLVCHLGLSATGNEIDKVWFHALAIQELVLGGLVFVIAQVMQVGREIEEDRSQFV